MAIKQLYATRVRRRVWDLPRAASRYEYRQHSHTEATQRVRRRQVGSKEQNGCCTCYRSRYLLVLALRYSYCDASAEK